MTTAIKLVEERLIETFWENFNCQFGPRMAWFEIPQRSGDPVRATYVVYAVSGPDLYDTEDWFNANVISPLIEESGAGRRLYWRNDEQLTVKTRNVSGKEQFVIRTRIAVINTALEDIRIDDAIKPEGVRPTELT